jgi:hypothetical protein
MRLSCITHSIYHVSGLLSTLSIYVFYSLFTDIICGGVYRKQNSLNDPIKQ